MMINQSRISFSVNFCKIIFNLVCQVGIIFIFNLSLRIWINIICIIHLTIEITNYGRLSTDRHVEHAGYLTAGEELSYNHPTQVLSNNLLPLGFKPHRNLQAETKGLPKQEFLFRFLGKFFLGFLVTVSVIGFKIFILQVNPRS
jgi:hypothetical protein